jgi:formate dehydrogenase major subunit
VAQRPENPYHDVGDARYPYVITTHRLTEHQTGGQMSRPVAWLAETQPEGFVEIGRELAVGKGHHQNGDWVTLSTARAEVEAKALVTPRIQPLRLGDRIVHVVSIPWHFGYKGLAQGDIANDLCAMVGDANVTMHEGKAFTCNVRRGRKGER